jgi:hypothetical protein
MVVRLRAHCGRERVLSFQHQNVDSKRDRAGDLREKTWISTLPTNF